LEYIKIISLGSRNNIS